MASKRARRVNRSLITSARLSMTGWFGSRLGAPCTVVVASPAFWGTGVVAAAAPMLWASGRAAGTGASDTGELVVWAFGAPWVWVLASPAFGGRSELPAAGAVWA